MNSWKRPLVVNCRPSISYIPHHRRWTPASTPAVDLRYRIDDGEVGGVPLIPRPGRGQPTPDESDHRSFASRGGEGDGFPGVGSCIGRPGAGLVKGRPLLLWHRGEPRQVEKWRGLANGGRWRQKLYPRRRLVWCFF